jgi:hypothetical protein
MPKLLPFRICPASEAYGGDARTASGGIRNQDDLVCDLGD